RLLENGANNSFVNQLADQNYSIDKLTTLPHEKLMKYKTFRNPRIPLPKDLFGE
ncbi:unnamed protein product, partial [Heterosigma akashiwo]